MIEFAVFMQITTEKLSENQFRTQRIIKSCLIMVMKTVHLAVSIKPYAALIVHDTFNGTRSHPAASTTNPQQWHHLGEITVVRFISYAARIFKAIPRVGCPQLNASKLVFPPVDRGLIKFNSYPPPAHHLDSGLIWFSASIGARCLLTVYDSCSTGADKKERINNRCKNLAHAHGDGCCSFFFVIARRTMKLRYGSEVPLGCLPPVRV